MNYSRELLIGRWYRSDTDEQRASTTEYAEMSADGSYEFTFIRQNEQGDILEQIIELGDWGLVGDIHFTMAKSEFVDEQHYAADLADPDNYHAYRVLKLDSKIFEYQHVVTNEVFILRRVTDKIGHC
ncbi:hypothetical protein AAD001_10410 [Colwelliaceae bacterium 6471]